MITVKKIRKNVGDIQFVLMEKSISAAELQQESFTLTETEESLRAYIDSQLESITIPQQVSPTGQTIQQSNIPTQIVQFSEEALDISTESFLGIVANDPIDGSILEYNGGEGTLIWGQKYDPTDILESIEAINGLIEDIQDLLGTHTHIADQIYGGTFPDSEYSFANEVRATTVTYKNSSNVDKYNIKFNTVTNSLDITYIG
jgi:hypothetical protein